MKADVGGDQVASMPDLDSLRAEIKKLRAENKALKMAVEELERVVDRDTLTPLYNRRFFMNALYQRQSRLARHGERSALLFVDVNGLKAINDRHGHMAGDFALIEVATRLKAEIRGTDVVARIGGDEFAVILDRIDEDGAIAKAKMLDAVVRAEPARFQDLLIPLGVSIGCAMITAEDSEEQLLARADQAMYRSKAQRVGTGSSPA